MRIVCHSSIHSAERVPHRGHTHIHTHTQVHPGSVPPCLEIPSRRQRTRSDKIWLLEAWLADMLIAESGITRCLAGANRFLAGLAALAGGPGTSKTRRITSGLGRVLSGSQPGSGIPLSIPSLLAAPFLHVIVSGLSRSRAAGMRIFVQRPKALFGWAGLGGNAQTLHSPHSSPGRLILRFTRYHKRR